MLAVCMGKQSKRVIWKFPRARAIVIFTGPSHYRLAVPVMYTQAPRGVELSLARPGEGPAPLNASIVRDGRPKPGDSSPSRFGVGFPLSSHREAVFCFFAAGSGPPVSSLSKHIPRGGRQTSDEGATRTDLLQNGLPKFHSHADPPTA